MQSSIECIGYFLFWNVIFQYHFMSLFSIYYITYLCSFVGLVQRTHSGCIPLRGSTLGLDAEFTIVAIQKPRWSRPIAYLSSLSFYVSQNNFLWVYFGFLGISSEDEQSRSDIQLCDSQTTSLSDSDLAQLKELSYGESMDGTDDAVDRELTLLSSRHLTRLYPSLMYPSP